MIQSIRIQNFKSIRDITVELSDVTVLVGRSRTGKSNFVQAIQFLRDTLIFQSPQTPGLNNWPDLKLVRCESFATDMR